MAAFRFRLQQLLELRQAERQAQAAALSRARAQEDGARRVLADRAEERARLLAQAADEGGAPVDLDAWSASRADYQGARRQEAAAADRVRAAEAAVQQAQGAYLEARREERVLGRLRERRLEEWRVGEASSEQAALDEAAARRGGEAGNGRG